MDIAKLAEFIKPHRKDSLVLVGFLITALVLFALFLLGSEVAEGDTFALDKAILRGLRSAQDVAVPIGPHWLKTMMVDFTALGGAPVLTLITVLSVGFLCALRKFATAGFVALSVSAGALLSALIKAQFVRPRPELVPHLVEVSSPSFPSGHSMNSAIVYLTLAVLLARSQSSRRVQVYLIGSAVLLALLVGSTRVYLGVHWPSDVLAGWSVGAIWAVVCSLAAKYLQAERKIEHAGKDMPEKKLNTFESGIVDDRLSRK